MPVWTTEGLPGSAQFGFWREVICDAFAALDPKPLARSAVFPSRVVLDAIGPINVAQIVSCAQTVTRGAQQIRIDPQDRLFVNLQIAGAGRVTQDDRVANLTPGSFALVDTARAYRLEFSDDFEVLSFRVPRHHVLPLMGERDAVSVFARRIDGDHGLGRVAAGFMRLLAESADRLDDGERSELAAHLCQLVASSAREKGTSDPTPLHAVRRRFLRSLIAFVEDSLDDPGLSVTTLALRFGVSERYVQQVFAEAGMTAVGLIRASRLQRCAHDLANPSDRRTIAAIASAWGFGDIPHFTRMFGRRFGCSPRAYRGRFRDH